MRDPDVDVTGRSPVAAPVRGRGWLVCLEGIDGAGKTTAVAALGDRLRRGGAPVVVLDKTTCAFPSAYVDRHLGSLRELIWGHPPDDPFLELGDLHWVYLQAAWYHAVAKCVVEPLLREGTLVLTDTWTHKYLAKLAMRPVDARQVRAAFAGLPRPDLVIGLSIDPSEAARRKDVIRVTEAGDREGHTARTADAFVAYQTRLAGSLRALGRDRRWTWVDVGGRSVDEVAALLERVILQAIPVRARSAAGRAGIPHVGPING